MTNTTDKHDSGFGKAIDVVARAFEKRWHQDHALVVEQFFGSIDQLLKPLGIDATKPDVRDAIRKELIHLEMDLRCAHGQPVVRAEYFSRFREIPSAVEEALERVRRLYPRCFRGPVLQSTDTRVGAESEGLFCNFETVDQPEVPSELGPYREITYIGSGGFGDVYKAIDSRWDEAVALKFPRHRPDSSTDGIENVKAEAEMAMRLNHPGIVSTRAIENIDTHAFIVQDFVDGMELKKFMERSELEQRDVGLLVALIADALAYAHREGIIHRDIKPQNILVDKNGKPYVADFGLAIHSNQRYETIGQPVCGTKDYFSPEVVSGRMYQIGGFYDVWSLGIVFYQLLTGKRPFDGPNDKILFEEIVQKDPEPPHVLNQRVDPELDRLCLQCLEKQPGRRMSARKLADDLQSWLKQPTSKKRTDTTTTSRAPKFVPRGLHSYTAKDAPFFLRLLPGPRDEHGIPASIRFWRDRILEPVAQEDRVPVGVIYGPSGSGKSSYVKAGLIPLIDHQVKSVYVESTRADTDVRLLRALRHEFDIPADASSLPEIFAGLRDGKWQRESRKKILICLDQFEQRLSSVGEFDPTELINALRHCDGENLQCLLLVRDDFLMSMSRFADALDMDLREGQNTQIVDLFDRRHARKILTLLGHAYDCLTSDNIDELSKKEIAFVNRAVDDQVEDRHVICVRLSVFAEMFKNQAWSVENLQEAGSVTGVGVQFLDRELGPQNRKIPHQAVFRLLCSLLPAAGTDIRGAMQGEAELAVAAGLPIDSPAFKKVVALLDNELRLITRTDPDVSGVVEVDEDNAVAGERHFQLTHDYLVPSIRAWQDKWLGDTRRGRAELRLQRLASQVVPGKKPENLPTHLEWLSWQVLLRRHRFTAHEQAVMRSARRRFLKDSSLAASILVVVGGLISWVWVKQSRDQIARGLVDNLMGPGFNKVPNLAKDLIDYPTRVPNLLKERKAYKFDQDETTKLKISLGLLPFDPNSYNEIVPMILRINCSWDALEASTDLLRQFSQGFEQGLLATLEDREADPRSRFRAAVSLVRSGNFQIVNWSEHTGMIGSTLVREPVTTQAEWIRLLSPIGDSLWPGLAEMFAKSDEPTSANCLANALFAFSEEPDRARYFADRLIQSGDNDAQFAAILGAFEAQEKQLDLLNALLQTRVNFTEQQTLAIRALALLRLGRDKEFCNLLKDPEHLGTRSYAIVRATPARIDFVSLKKLYDSPNSEDDLFRQAILMAFAERVDSTFDGKQIETLDQIVEDRCINDEDAGCFAAAELIARRRGEIDLMKYREKRRAKSDHGVFGRIFINSQLQAFSIIEVGGKCFAVSMTEVSQREFGACPDFEDAVSELPQVISDMASVQQYCNWLTLADGLAESEKAYADDVFVNFKGTTLPIDPSRSGYRLINHTEWLACNSYQTKGRPYQFTDDIEIARRFAWTIADSNGTESDVGTKLPNQLGFFDLYGNVFEICSRPESDAEQYLQVGGFARSFADDFTTDYAYAMRSKPLPDSLPGIRIARRLSTNGK